MVIKRLKLVNYRRFRMLDLEFPQNIIGILGRNGAGKSTLLEAIGWILFGTRAVRTDKQDIRNHALDGGDPCVAELEFDYGGHEYRIERQLRGKNAISEAALYRDGSSEADAVQDRGVNEFVEQLLHLDYRSFYASVFARQKDLDALSAMQSEERRKSINRLIKIDVIDKARERVRQNRNEKQRFIEGQQSWLSDPRELEGERNTALARQDALKKKAKEQETRIQSAENHYRELKGQLDVQNETRDRYLEYQSRLTTLDSRINENADILNKTRAELEEIEKAEKSISELSPQVQRYEEVRKQKEHLDVAATRWAQLKAKREERERLDDAYAREQKREASFRSVVGQRSSWERKRDENNECLMALRDELKTLREKRDHWLERRGVALEAGQERKEKRSRVVSLGREGRCPLCHQSLEDHYDRVVAEFDAELSKYRTEYRAARDTVQTLTEELALAEEKLEHCRKEGEEVLSHLNQAKEASRLIEESLDALKQIETQREQLDRDIQDLSTVAYDEVEHARVKKEFDTLVQTREQLFRLEERAARRQTVQNEMDRLNRLLAELTDERTAEQEHQNALRFDADAFNALKERVGQQEEVVRQEQQAYSLARESLVSAQNEVERVEKTIFEQEQRRKDIARTEQDVVYLQALDHHFGRFRRELAGRVRPIIAGRASELLSLTTSARYTLLDLDEDYNIGIYDGNQKFPIQHFSGGEQDLANLCLRIAVSQVVAERSSGSPISFIVLDEIFGSQDEERRELILNAFVQLSSQFRQIFVITHVEAIKDVLPVIIQVDSVDPQTSTALLL